MAEAGPGGPVVGLKTWGAKWGPGAVCAGALDRRGAGPAQEAEPGEGFGSQGSACTLSLLQVFATPWTV